MLWSKRGRLRRSLWARVSRSALASLWVRGGVCAALGGCIGVHGQQPVEPVVQPPSVEQASTATVAEALDPNIPERAARVTLAPTEHHQTLEGFGAALAWYQDLIVDGASDELYEFLFPELGLDILRFRNRFERSDPRDGDLRLEVEIFRRATQALGHRPKLMLSSWSPPAPLKANGKERCFGNDDCTLKKREGRFVYDEFADWWLRSLQHYQSLGLSPDYISIQNEPDFIPGDWEGCKFEPEESNEYPGYGKALAAVHQRLTTFTPRPKLLGPEMLGIHYDRVPKYLAGLDESLLDGLAHHIYESGADGVWDWRDPGPDSFLDEMSSVREATDLPLYQTEFNTDQDRGIDGGFETAWLVHHTMVTEQAVAFLYWDLIWPHKRGLVTMVGRKAQPRDHYYSMRHYSLYTDPGDVRVGADSDSDQVLVSAYQNPSASRVTLVMLNTGQGVAQIDVDAGGFTASRASAHVTTYRPGNSRRWQEQTVDASATRIRLPARSVGTVVLQR